MNEEQQKARIKRELAEIAANKGKPFSLLNIYTTKPSARLK